MYQSKIESIIIRLKKAKNESPEMTLQKISEQTGVSMSTVTRIFADGSENQSSRYESLKPLAQLLLHSDGLDEELDNDEFQMQINELKDKYDKKLEKERENHQKSLDFLKHQIALKDDRITLLLNALEDRSEQFKELHRNYNELMAQLLENKELISKLSDKQS